MVCINAKFSKLMLRFTYNSYDNLWSIRKQKITEYFANTRLD